MLVFSKQFPISVRTFINFYILKKLKEKGVDKASL